MNPTLLTRREAIIKMAVLMGGTMVGPRLLHGAWDPNSSVSGGEADAAELALLDEIGETIIPATEIPGAKAVHIGAFITMMLRDCYEPADQAAIAGGIRELGLAYRAKYGRDFVGAPADDRTEFLNTLDLQQKTYSRNKKTDGAPHYFRVLKELTVIGYFSSKIGATQALRFMEVPGKFDGNVSYQKGDRAWFS